MKAYRVAIEKMEADQISFAVFVSVTALCGIIGNTLIIAVYFVKKHSFAIRKYILTLSVVDLIINVLIIPYSAMFEFKMITNDGICHGMEIIRHASIGFSNLILILIAGERLLMVWKPMRNVVSSQMKTALILCLLTVSTISAVPAALIFEVESHDHHYSPENGIHNTTVRNERTEKYCRYTSSKLGGTGSKIYRDFLSFMIATELLLLIVFYVIIYVILYCNRRRLRRSMSFSTGQRQENRQTPRRENNSTQSNPDIIPMNNMGGGSTAPQSSVDNEAESTIHDSSATSQGDVNTNQARRNRAQRTHKKILRFSKTTSYVRTKTWTMMFACTFIYLVCWVPFFFAIFNVYDLLVFRYFFFLGHATNPIVYSVINEKVRKGIKEILTKKLIKCFRE